MEPTAKSTDKAVGIIGAVGIDVNNLERCAEFWAAVLGVDIVGRLAGVYVGLQRQYESAPFVFVQRVPGAKTVKNRVHLDIRVDDVDAAIAKVETLGGRLGRIVEGADLDPGQRRFAIMTDPDGNEFCLD